jgi:hypothetical protein
MGVLEAVLGPESESELELEESNWFVGEWMSEWMRMSIGMNIGGSDVTQGAEMQSIGIGMVAMTPVRVEEALRGVMWVDSCHGGRISRLDFQERLFGRGRMLVPKPQSWASSASREE